MWLVSHVDFRLRECEKILILIRQLYPMHTTRLASHLHLPYLGVGGVAGVFGRTMWGVIFTGGRGDVVGPTPHVDLLLAVFVHSGLLNCIGCIDCLLVQEKEMLVVLMRGLSRFVSL